MNPGDLSVVVPCHNVGSTLAEQLDALLAQDWRGAFEVVLVENRSTDDTLAVARAYAARDPRVRVVTAEERGGASYAAQHRHSRRSRREWWCCATATTSCDQAGSRRWRTGSPSTRW